MRRIHHLPELLELIVHALNLLGHIAHIIITIAIIIARRIRRRP